jgi:uncharacterized protein YbjT (DUF2867 family)
MASPEVGEAVVNRVLIAGASGNVGQQVVSQLLAADVPIRALSRNPDSAGLPPEVEVVRGDLTLPETLEECLDGIGAVFLVWTAPPDGVAGTLERIAKHARRIVFLSSPHRIAHPFFQAAQPNPITSLQVEIERRIEASGLQWTFLRPGMFAGNARHWWPRQIRAGDVVRWPYALAQTAPIDERDIAAVAVRALCDDGHAGADYVLTGPQSLTQREQVAAIGDVLGRSLRLEEITPDEWLRELPPYIPPFIGKMLLAAWAAAVGQPAYVTSTVAEVTGVPARTFRDWAVDNAAEFQ